MIVQVNHIEDSKGNAGDSGMLKVSNLRCIWYSIVDTQINLSIGISYPILEDMNVLCQLILK